MKWFKQFMRGFSTPLALETIDSLTPRARQVLALARKEAARSGQSFVGTEHLLLGLIHLGQGFAVSELAKMGLNLQSVRAEVEMQGELGADRETAGHIPYAPRVREVLALAAREAKALTHTYVGVEHILLGILQEEDGITMRVLQQFKVNIEETRRSIFKELEKKS
jgi:ATP-dependent Clp protease ATP-binding subunit ClpC